MDEEIKAFFRRQQQIAGIVMAQELAVALCDQMGWALRLQVGRVGLEPTTGGL